MFKKKRKKKRTYKVYVDGLLTGKGREGNTGKSLYQDRILSGTNGLAYIP